MYQQVQKQPNIQEWFTPDEAAEYLRVSRPTVYRYMRDGVLAYYELPKGGRRLKRSDLDSLLQKSESS